MSNASKVKVLEAKLARVAEEYTRTSWDLTLAKANAAVAVKRAGEMRRGEYVPEPTDETAKLILAAGRKRRGEIQ